MELEIFVKSLSKWEKNDLLSLLKSEWREREEKLRELTELNKAAIDRWSNFRISTKTRVMLRSTIAAYFAENNIHLVQDVDAGSQLSSHQSFKVISEIDNYDFKLIRNLGPRTIAEFNELNLKNKEK